MNKPLAQHRGIIAWFVGNPVAANLLMFFIIVVGLYGAVSIKKSLTPEFEINAMNIVVPYPGASPAEVERGVIFKIEEAIKDISSIKRVASVANDSMARVNIEIVEGYDINQVLNEVKIAVDAISSFPKQAERAVVSKIDPSWQAIQLQIYGPALTESAAKTLADEMKRELLATTDIARVKVYGTRDYEVAVEVSESVLRRYGLTLGKIALAIQRASVDLPAGAINTANGDVRLRVSGQAYRQQDFEQIELLVFADGTRLLLGDIATIKDGFVEATGSALFDETYSVALAVYAVGDQDLVVIADQAKAYVTAKKQTLPPGVTIDYWADSTYYLDGRLSMMVKNLAIGALLVFITLGLFMELSIAFWVMIGIPVCFLGTFIMLPLVGVSINMISLFGFILVLGIVVDDAIIIGESIHSTMLTDGDSHSSVIMGAHKVATPATFGVLTTICAFLPTLFMSGTLANFPAACGFVVIFCLMFSLIESKWILPAHIAHRKQSLFRWVRSERHQRLQTKCNAHLQRFVVEKYQPFLHRCIAERYTTLAAFIGIFILTIGMMGGGWVRYVMHPDSPNDYVSAQLEMMQGTNELKTVEAVNHIKQAIRQVEQRYLTETGSDKSFIKHFFNYSADGRIGFFMLELTKQEERSVGSLEIVEQWQQQVGEIIGAKVLTFSAVDDQIGEDIAYNLVSDDPVQLRAAAAELTAQLKGYSGLSNVQNGIGDQISEIDLAIKPAAQAVGLSLFDIGSQVREAFYGREAQRVQRGFDEIKVMVRYPEQQRQSLSNLENMTIRGDGGDEFPLLSVAELDSTMSEATITRINGLQAAQVTAKADKTVLEPSVVNNAIINVFFPELFQRYPAVDYQLDGSTQESEVMERELFVGFGLALLGIYALLAIPLRSYTQPIIIMSVIPFGLIGAVVGHALMGVTVSMMSIFGIIALAGVVVNDSLIMVDHINRRVKGGEAIDVAVVGAGKLRFRAIVLTSLTTFFGVLPMLLETSVQAQFVIPMAISLGFGIVFATVITLLLVPCLYMILSDFNAPISKTKPVNA
ncbi:Multidrug resistance protein MexB [Sinobacterium norvegicum]|uniref:Multidrug resistance protein MexB n=1 Tax=Sinobacterium norvegicum TaxID=1641715 RepID=A0ABN8EGS3_9GAMM|nr:efflux RND transporter permease subunit [Sinobacterium norvegicum]CAH0990895.1 Multidrug resistance protein MexB [Sinobacterium norvegicum]